MLPSLGRWCLQKYSHLLVLSKRRSCNIELVAFKSVDPHWIILVERREVIISYDLSPLAPFSRPSESYWSFTLLKNRYIYQNTPKAKKQKQKQNQQKNKQTNKQKIFHKLFLKKRRRVTKTNKTKKQQQQKKVCMKSKHSEGNNSSKVV